MGSDLEHNHKDVCKEISKFFLEILCQLPNECDVDIKYQEELAEKDK